MYVTRVVTLRLDILEVYANYYFTATLLVLYRAQHGNEALVILRLDILEEHVLEVLDVGALAELGIVPLQPLCHLGLPLHDLQCLAQRVALFTQEILQPKNKNLLLLYCYFTATEILYYCFTSTLLSEVGLPRDGLWRVAQRRIGP
jgi:hypothetical protein